MRVQNLSKAKLKQYSALSLKKYRYRTQQFLIEGNKMVKEAISSGWDIEAIILIQERAEEAEDFAPHTVYLTEESTFRQISQQPQPEGILAVLPFPETPTWPPDCIAALPPGPGFILEDMQDPGNLGTLIRTADWLGFQSIICSKGSVDVLNPKVLRSTMGSFFRVPVYYFSDLPGHLSNHLDHCWAADMDGQRLDQASFGAKDYIVLGNEANGLSVELRQLAGLKKLHIPGRGGAESLNAAIAGAMIGWQLFCHIPKT